MKAKVLEALLEDVARKTDLAQRNPADMVQRFQKMRDAGLLTKSRGKNARHLSPDEIVGGVLSIVSAAPGYGGVISKILMDLRPVGGPPASFAQASTFGGALQVLLDDPLALDSLREIRISGSEIYRNCHGRGVIVSASDEGEKTAYYVGKNARSLLGKGAVKTYEPRDLISSIITETVIFPELFKEIVRELEGEKEFRSYTNFLVQEEDDETQAEQVVFRRPNSRFLNIGVDNQVTWPNKQATVNFEGHELILMPKTRENTTSVHVDLHHNRLSDEAAMTLISRFLSILSWCDDQFAVMEDGWSGNPIPVAVPRRNLAFITAHHWIFDRKIPQSPEARKAIAIYRESRNAEQNYLVGYAVLGYYKIIEIKHKDDADVRNWLRAGYERIKGIALLAKDVKRFEEVRKSKAPQNYLWEACRCAVAHANQRSPSDPDDLLEIRRFHVAANILRHLARLLIEEELGVSTCPYDGS